MAITYNKEVIKKDRLISTRGPRDLQNKHKLSSGDSNEDLIAYLKEEINKLTRQLQERPTAAASGGLYTDDQLNDEILKALTVETAQLKLEHERQVKTLQVEAIKLSNEVDRLTAEIGVLKRSMVDAEKEIETQVDKIANAIKSQYDSSLDSAYSKIKLLEETHKIEIAALNEKLSFKESMIESLKSQKSEFSFDDSKLTSLLTEATRKIDELTSARANEVADQNRPKMDTVFVDPTESDKDDYEYKIDIGEDVSHKKKEEMANKVNKLKNLMGSLPSKRPA